MAVEFKELKSIKDVLFIMFGCITAVKRVSNSQKRLNYLYLLEGLVISKINLLRQILLKMEGMEIIISLREKFRRPCALTKEN